MSDLSMPPLSLVPQEGAAPPDAQERFSWPTPPFASYAPPQPMMEPLGCEIEGTNGRLMKGQLVMLDTGSSVAQVIVAPARSAMPLRFSQFRRLILTEPLTRQPVPTGDAALQSLDRATSTKFNIALNGAPALEGQTLGHVETESGLFLFEPLGEAGHLRRSFVPRAAYSHADIGQRIGEVLIEQHLATPQQVQSALEQQSQLRHQKIGDILLTKQIVTPEQLVEAIAQQSRMPMVRIGEALIALGFITTDQLNEALAQQREDRSVPLGEVLVRMGYVTRPDLQTALARKMGYPLVDVTNFPAETDALAKLPYPVATRLQALPLLLRAGRLIVALDDPSRPDKIDEIEFAIQGKVLPVLAFSQALPGAIDKAYERMGADVQAAKLAAAEAEGSSDYELDDAGKLLASLEQQTGGEHEDGDASQIEQSDNSLVRLINSMIVEAQTQGVSDIHVECQPGKQKVKIRFRKDGLLRPYIELPHTYRSALIARIKIMCDLDISERRKPQDGKINFGKFVPGARLELRVATIPTNNGLEDAVLRLLASAKPIPLNDLGLAPENLRKLKAASERPYGMLLCVGPTGSGKTTTLHSVLGFINTPERKLWTAEDPVEITQAGIRQVQVNPKIDFTFAKALKAFLRADPDVIMVGEIRDSETAQMAVEASLTGHLVMSTLHTNSACETVTRLLDMGMDPFNFGDSLLAVLAQRLVRRLCPHCRTARQATPAEVDELVLDHSHAFPPDMQPERAHVMADWQTRFASQGELLHHDAPGCKHCEGTGRRGRAALHELLIVTRELRRLIQTGRRVEELQRQGLIDGMRTLRQDGIEKVLTGVTTIGEVRAMSNA